MSMPLVPVPVHVITELLAVNVIVPLDSVKLPEVKTTFPEVNVALPDVNTKLPEVKVDSRDQFIDRS